jgi:probable phosphoglycerate mutase
MRLHIVRHGQTDWNAENRIQGQLDSQLDDTGIKQAVERGKDFTPGQFHAVYSSSSVRTRQTTFHLLNGQVGGVNYLEQLREVSLGVWEGHLWKDVIARFPEMADAHRTGKESFSVEGAEKSSEVQTRGVAAIESIISAHKDKPTDVEILIVSHGAIMRTILAHYLQVPLSDLHTLPSLPNCGHCIVDTKGDQRTVVQIAGKVIEDTPWKIYQRNNNGD